MTHDDFLDTNTAERLLSGAVPAADAPPGYGPVASVLAAAATPGSLPEMDFEELARVARCAADRSGPSPTRRSPLIGKLLTMKAAAAAGVILISATGAAAATGSLPSAVQRVAHSTLSHVGVDVPNDDATEHQNDQSNHDGQQSDDPTTTTTTPADGSVATVPATGDHGQDGADTATDDHGQDPTDATTGEHGQAGDQSGDTHDGGSVATPPTTVPNTDGGSGSGPGDSGSGDSGHGGSGSGHGGSDQQHG
jgi:hypothetical protein